MASGDAIPKLRWRIGALLAFGILVNYIDRINLSVAAPQIQAEFGLTSVQLGWLFSSFFWLYAPWRITAIQAGIPSSTRANTGTCCGAGRRRRGRALPGAAPRC